MKKFISSVFVLIFLGISLYAQGPKFIFYFIGDGMGINHVVGTQMYNAAVQGQHGLADLNFTTFPYKGYVQTYSASALVTDSAAAGTALATGVKANNGSLGVDAQNRPVMSVARILKEHGYGAGVVTTVGVNHATPAAFYANMVKRSKHSEIFDQLLEGRVHFAAGGDILVTDGDRENAQQLVDKARKAGWSVYLGDECKDRVGKAEKTLCIGGRLGSHELEYAIDNRGEISLEDLTASAIKNLSTYHPDAFFLMIEGGSIDHSAHGNDAATTFHEINDMDKSVKLALDFYEKHPDQTLILVTADHETGGFSLGAGHYEMHPELLQYQKDSKGALNRKLSELRKQKNPKWEDAKEIISQSTGLWAEVKVSEKQEKNMREIFNNTFLGNDNTKDVDLYSSNEMLTKAAIDYLDKQACTVFRHSSHSGAPVPVYAIGKGALEISQCKDNTDIPKTLLKMILGE